MGANDAEFEQRIWIAIAGGIVAIVSSQTTNQVTTQVGRWPYSRVVGKTYPSEDRLREKISRRFFHLLCFPCWWRTNGRHFGKCPINFIVVLWSIRPTRVLSRVTQTSLFRTKVQKVKKLQLLVYVLYGLDCSRLYLTARISFLWRKNAMSLGPTVFSNTFTSLRF